MDPFEMMKRRHVAYMNSFFGSMGPLGNSFDLRAPSLFESAFQAPTLGSSLRTSFFHPTNIGSAVVEEDQEAQIQEALRLSMLDRNHRPPVVEDLDGDEMISMGEALTMRGRRETNEEKELRLALELSQKEEEERFTRELKRIEEEERALLIAQQNSEYEHSVQEDKKKEQQLLEIENWLKESASYSEPEPTTNDVATLMIILPNNERLNRRFNKSDLISDVKKYVNSEVSIRILKNREEYWPLFESLVLGNYELVDFKTAVQDTVSLEEAKLYPRALLSVRAL